MRRILFLAASLAFVAGCKEATAPLVATSIALSTPSLTFDAVGATAVVTAIVNDQNGTPMTDAAVTFTSGGAAATVVGSASPAGGATGTVTSVANGATSITVRAGQATAVLPVTVAQAVASLVPVGDRQSGTVNIPLPTQVGVRLLDRLGAAIAGRTVGFSIALGGGALSAPTATSGADGVARITWTLGTVATEQELAVAAGAVSGRLTATATAGAPATVQLAGGANQVARVGMAVAVAPSVRVADAFNNPVPNVLVTFAVTGGGGSVTGERPATNASGIATVGSFVVGPDVGTNTLVATVAGLPPVTFTASATATGAPGTVAPVAGNLQAGIAGSTLPANPAVLVRNSAGQPVVDAPVTFSVQSGGGSITGATTRTDANGIARVGSWRLGAVATPNVVHAVVTSTQVPETPVVFTAIGCTPNGATGYSISVCFTTPVTATQRDAFVNAANRWSAVITGDLPDVAQAIDNPCASGLGFTGIDDLAVLAAVVEIDGPGGTLGSAGPCVIRTTGSYPIVGTMRFDVTDMATLESRSQLESVILHEMGHVIGIGTMWQTLGLLNLPSTATEVNDTHFSGARAAVAFDQIGGTSYTGGQKVPVENTGGAGTRNGHWRESVLRTELMTGFLQANVPNPLSILTINALQDMGYTVNPAAADPFTFSLTAQLNASRLMLGEDPAKVIDLGNDLYTGPLHRVDSRGRMTRIR